MNEEQELEQVTGDSVVMLPLVRESEEEPTLLLLPSRISEDRLEKGNKDPLVQEHEALNKADVLSPLERTCRRPILPLSLYCKTGSPENSLFSLAC